MVGTIEPRKNHLTVLNLWRAIVESGYRGPKLVLVGGRGWLNDETTAMLDRCCAFEGVVAETSGLGDKALRTLISNARALLAPSFAEGYGLPITEALELGTPVIASNLPVFREVSQGDAILIDPNDGVAWRSAILALSDNQSDFSREVKRKALNHPRVDPGGYFDCVEAFINSL
jgi:glycosyltransferase involved in cell wall biosynthesis